VLGGIEDIIFRDNSPDTESLRQHQMPSSHSRTSIQSQSSITDPYLLQNTRDEVIATKDKDRKALQQIIQTQSSQISPNNLVHNRSTNITHNMDNPTSDTTEDNEDNSGFTVSYPEYASQKRKNRVRKLSRVDINIINNNINGLQMNSNSNRLETIITQMQLTKTDILLLQEVNTNIAHSKFKTMLQRLKGIHSRDQFIFAGAPSTEDSLYLPGGTAILIRHPISQYVTKRIIDPMGRWCGVILKMRQLSIFVISVYQPPKNQNKQGTINNTSQQSRWLLDQGLTISVHEKFRQDLIQVLSEQQQEGHLIIAAGDFNEHSSNDPTLKAITQSVKLIDIFPFVGITDPTSTRGPYVLDRMFLSSELVSNITAQKLEKEDFLVSTDHYPLILSLAIHSESTEDYDTRGLTSNHMQKVTTYIEKVHNHMKKGKLFEAIDQLTMTDCSSSLLDSIDQKLLSIRLMVEKNMKTHYKDWWHRDLKTWKAHLKKCNKELKEFKKAIPKPHNKILSLLQQRQIIIQKFQAHTQHSFQMRHKILKQEIARLKQSKENNKKLNHLKSILKTERTRELYKKISLKTKPPTKQHFSLQIQNQDSSDEEITDTTEIAQHIAQHNKNHFSQANDTPLSSYKINFKPSEPSNTGSNNSTSSRHNNHEKEDNLPQDKEYLQHKFQTNICKPPIKERKVEIEYQEWINQMKHWKERTTTSPSGLHLGHHKALFSPHKFTFEEDSEKKSELDEKQQDILQAYMTIYNLALKHMIILSRWKVVHSIVLFKDKSNRYLHRIRNIHIYEADYNLLLKQKWGEAVSTAEEHSLLHPAQFGSRKNKRSLDPIFSEIMMQEISRLTVIPFIQINYDAQACYDRIIPEIALQISLKYGVHENIIKLVRKVMLETKYYIKIGNTVTRSFYSHTSDFKLFGTGQGSGFSPHIWTLLSCELFHLYSEYSTGFGYMSPFSKNQSQLHITAYVDDVNTHQTFPSSINNRTMISQASCSAQRWYNILHISGGQLSPSKCNYYAVKWSFATTGRSKLETHNFSTLVIKDHLNQPFYIQNKPTNNSHKSLGYLQSIATPKLYQKQKLEEVINQTTQVLTLVDLDYIQTRVFYHTIFSPKIQYFTQLTSLSRPTLLASINKCNILTLQKMGYSSATPKGMYFGHKTFAGLELIDPYVYQGSQNVINLIRALQKHHPNSSLVKTTYFWWLFQDGRSICPLTDPESIDSITDSVWFSELKVFLRTYQITLHLHLLLPPLQRKNDQYIMDVVYNQNYTKKVISNINQCRLFLQVLTISDITTVDGTCLESGSLEHKSTWRQTHTSFKTMRPKPNKSIWHYWTTFLSTLTYTNSKRLKIPLGDWLVSIQQIRTMSKTFRDQNYIYTKRKNQILKTNIGTQHQESISTLPSHVIPCVHSFNTIFPTSYMRSLSENNNNQQETNFILPETILIFTDASVQNQVSAIAWIVTDCKGKILYQHQQHLTEHNISSFRAEAIGVCSVI
jgi:hypothetical protein